MSIIGKYDPWFRCDSSGGLGVKGMKGSAGSMKITVLSKVGSILLSSTTASLALAVASFTESSTDLLCRSASSLRHVLLIVT